MFIKKLAFESSVFAGRVGARWPLFRSSIDVLNYAAISMVIWAVTGACARADPATLEVSEAWSPPAEKSSDLPVYMIVTNSGEADDILRGKCPTIAHFTEKRTTDYGEGVPAAREVKSIPIKDHDTTTLKPGGFYVTLLKITGAVKVGDTFECQIVFRRAGSKDVRVSVARPKS